MYYFWKVYFVPMTFDFHLETTKNRNPNFKMFLVHIITLQESHYKQNMECAQ